MFLLSRQQWAPEAECSAWSSGTTTTESPWKTTTAGGRRGACAGGRSGLITSTLCAPMSARPPRCSPARALTQSVPGSVPHPLPVCQTLNAHRRPLVYCRWLWISRTHTLPYLWWPHTCTAGLCVPSTSPSECTNCSFFLCFRGIEVETYVTLIELHKI